MVKKKTNQLKITIYGYDVDTTEETTRLVTEKLSQLKAMFSGPLFLRTKKKVISVPISPHKHKDAQEQFEKRIHRRVIMVDITPTILESLEKIKAPGTANLRLKFPFESSVGVK